MVAGSRLLVAVAIALAIAALPAEAQINQVDQIRDAFEASVNNVAGRLRDVAIRLLLSLFVIELVWSLGRIVMEQGDIGQVLAALARRVVIAGFFLALIDGIPWIGGQSVGIADFILLSAEALLGEVNPGTVLEPGEIFAGMANTGTAIWNNSTGPSGTISAAFVWLTLVILGAIMAGLILLAYIEIYVVFTIGIITLGFGIWQPTQQIATNFLFRAVGKIFKLVATLFIGAVIQIQLNAMAGLNSFPDGILIVGLCVILAMTLFVIPNSIEGLISGSSGSTAEGVVRKAGMKSVDVAGGAARGVVKAGGRAAGGGPGLGTRAGGQGLSNAIRSIKGQFSP